MNPAGKGWSSGPDKTEIFSVILEFASSTG